MRALTIRNRYDNSLLWALNINIRPLLDSITRRHSQCNGRSHEKRNRQRFVGTFEDVFGSLGMIRRGEGS